MADVSLQAIEEVLDKKVRPTLALHKGNVVIDRLEQGELYVRMTGQCSGCPSAEIELEELVSDELRESFPEIRKVNIITGVSDALIDEARRILREKHDAR